MQTKSFQRRNEQDTLESLYVPYLCKVQIDEAQSKELQAHRAAIQEPVYRSGQVIGSDSIAKVKGEQSSTEGCPKQAEEQKNTLVAPSLMAIE